MKLLRYGNKGREKPAALDKDGKIRDLSFHIEDFNSENLNFETLAKLQKIDLKSLPEVSNTSRIGPCISKPGKFIGIGLNYSDHAAETGAKPPSEPIVFTKTTNCVIGPNDDVLIPNNSKKTDWEVEIAFVIGKETKYIREEDAPSHIFGYCIVNDISEREWQIEKMGQWVKGKSADTFGPIGPYLVTKDEIPDVQKLNLSLDLNNQRMQTGNTSKMIFGINFILSYLSNFMSLQPGDIVTTGTPPGVGLGKKPPFYLKPGDEMRLTIDYLGHQHQRVK
ncbi:MAG: fumarylacetoacetate hydrolase family protein [Pelagibacteraceae bacterium]|jgi:2-keto-4-pentenoate hydratase/2-oxohepta-3-ene-1,7-dioic acid hydratase in catechol pathway|nr:fumarylacetoacetate hydrolase family protein [Pelagibacteraceae bacterium]MDP6710555.1 fumarylacetoacetate hydrolase family protein [Pelagibacteraceae bacterium]|tara:strand:- start:1371 stop:2207 length:837 start_codon:yes stop_codon:yes gene_type:complete